MRDSLGMCMCPTGSRMDGNGNCVGFGNPYCPDGQRRDHNGKCPPPRRGGSRSLYQEGFWAAKDPPGKKNASPTPAKKAATPAKTTAAPAKGANGPNKCPTGQEYDSYLKKCRAKCPKGQHMSHMGFHKCIPTCKNGEHNDPKTAKCVKDSMKGTSGPNGPGKPKLPACPVGQYRPTPTGKCVKNPTIVAACKPGETQDVKTKKCVPIKPGEVDCKKTPNDAKCVKAKNELDKILADYKKKSKEGEKKLIDKQNKEKAALKQQMAKDKKSAAEIQAKQKELIDKQKKEINNFHIEMSKKEEVVVNNFITMNTTNKVVNVVSNKYVSKRIGVTNINGSGKSGVKTADAPKNATPVPNSWVDWLRNIFNSIFGIEGFVDNDGNVQGASDGFVSFLIVVLFAIFAFGLLTAYSAARVSYCYNKFLGNSDSESFLWSILCFFFPQWYWTFYPFLFNPLCDIKKNRGINNLAMSGGKSRSVKKTKSVRRTR